MFFEFHGFRNLSKAVKSYHGIRRREEGSLLSQAKYDACTNIKRNMPDFRYTLQSLFYNEKIKDKKSAMNYLNDAASKTAALAVNETNINTLKKYVAQQIYIKSVQRSDYESVKHNNQLIKALDTETMQRGIKMIMDDNAFRQLTSSMTDEQMKKKCSEPDKLYDEYIRNMAKNEKLNQQAAQNQQPAQNGSAHAAPGRNRHL